MSTLAVKTISTTTAGENLILDPAGSGVITANSSSFMLKANGEVTFGGQVNASDFNSTSDARLKENVTPILNASDAIRQLQGVSFTWKDGGGQSYGLIAQEVEQIIPSLVEEQDETKRLKYLGLIAFLIESIKELQERVTALESQEK